MAKFLNLENVEKAATENPETFFIPSKEERTIQEIGDTVRLHFKLTGAVDGEPEGERMWVEITEPYKPGGWFSKAVPYKGRLTNKPMVIEDLSLGDEITFYPHHIAQTTIKSDDPRWVDSANLDAFVSEMCFKQGEEVRFVYRQRPHTNEESSGWTMLTGREPQEYADDPRNWRLAQVGYMLSLDHSLLEPLKSKDSDVAFERAGKGCPWKRVIHWRPPED